MKQPIEKTRVRFRSFSQTTQVFSSQVYENSNSNIAPTIFQFTLKSINLAAIAAIFAIVKIRNVTN